MCYEGIQRIYRNGIIRFLRLSMREIFPQEWESKLRSPFQKEWETMKQNATIPRVTGELTSQIQDDFDLLSVNHFFNLYSGPYCQDSNMVKIR